MHSFVAYFNNNTGLVRLTCRLGFITVQPCTPQRRGPSQLLSGISCLSTPPIERPENMQTRGSAFCSNTGRYPSNPEQGCMHQKHHRQVWTCSHAAQRSVATLDPRRPETHEGGHAWRGARPRVPLFMPLKSSRGDSSVWEMLLRESGVAKLDYYA